MAKTYTAEYVEATRIQAESNEKIAYDTNKTDLEVAKQESSAVIEQAKYDYEARIQESKDNYSVQMEALRVREEEAQLTYKVDYKNAMSEAVRADASMVTAQAKEDQVGVNQQKEEDNYAIDQLKYSNDDNNYWYG